MFAVKHCSFWGLVLLFMQVFVHPTPIDAEAGPAHTVPQHHLSLSAHQYVP
jgi:hypothetical protein